MVPPSRAGVTRGEQRSSYDTNQLKSPLYAVSEAHHARSQQSQALFFVWRAVYPDPQADTPAARRQGEPTACPETTRKVSGKLGADKKNRRKDFLRRFVYYDKKCDKSQMIENLNKSSNLQTVTSH